MDDDYVQLNGNERDVFYVYLPNHPGREITGVVSNSIRLRDLFVQLDRMDLLQLLGDADMILDCGEDGKLIGVEILT
ncbi:DUF2283 domain-containing protein [Rhizobium leguminosarum]|jgi:hypothetical protein|uniref:DUF2283 domain-containing protein n=1 Tax=Rhizobium TaxID=379 RepID=UPI0003757A9B|nr:MULTISPECIES: DUF2283 domain-containing protein [Rhizobium]MBW8791235.1 DUF2283 domain-containing protein [Rhizobium leguminosarum]MBY5356132.1 DUF2283 domain-containing protein [Rhizobium leguminosarum]MBY5367515.1 DUF2283 domain-containing protein [Rhizobium leguminosarum]MBY5450225.1 DUF2283 domain-containing protein [Rhizobium leguminosarum]NNG71735.1 DUF2283 domain-containing protein [Rhizobium laguerreae]